MKAYDRRPQSGQRAQKAWDVLAARYPAMQPMQLVSQLKNSLGWQWSMQFESRNGKTVFWDSVPVKEIKEMVSGTKRTIGPRTVSIRR